MVNIGVSTEEIVKYTWKGFTGQESLLIISENLGCRVKHI